MASVSAEALLISALLNNQDVAQAASFGINPAHFEGYKDEYNWLLNYLDTYGCDPSKDVFRVQFPNFMWSDHEDVRSACNMVFKAFNRRRLTTAITEAVELSSMGDSLAAYTTLMKAEPLTASPKPRKLLTDMSFLDGWDDEPPKSVEVPYYTLQKHTGGIRPGNLWYLAARPGQGKTAHVTNIVKHAVLTGNRVLFYSLEMSEMEVRARFHAALATEFGYHHLTLNAIRDRSVDAKTYKTFVGELSDRLEATGGALDIHTPSDGSVTPGVVAGRASEYDLNVIDYIGLMKSDSGHAAIEDWRVAAQISNSLKEIGLAQRAGILAAAQINRDGDSGAAPPKVKNLAQSDALGQDGDVVLTMRAMSMNVATHFSLEKNRHGAGGMSFYTTFDPNRGVFNEVSAEYADDLATDAEAAA